MRLSGAEPNRSIFAAAGSLGDLENWVQAEPEILKEAQQKRSRRMGIVVRVNGVRYVAEYVTDSSSGYTPGEFSAGDSVAVRLDDNQLFIRRPNGLELKTTIVKRG